MNIFKKIAETFKPLTINDPVFGTLRFQKVGFWEGKVHFKPLSVEVEVLVDADSTGPTEEQRRWFKEVELKYPSLLPEIVEGAMPRIQEWNVDLTKDKMLQELKLESISVNKCESGRHEWDLTFNSESLEHWVSVTLTDWTATKTTIDG
jgi:hypothetical protein